MIVAGLLTGCTEVKKIYELPERDEIIDHIREYVNNCDALKPTGFNDGLAWPVDFNSSTLGKRIAADDTLNHDLSIIRFGRLVSSLSQPVIQIDLGWDSARVAIRYQIAGTFKLIWGQYLPDGSTFEAIDSTSRNFQHTTYQRALFLRDGNTNNVARDWQLTHISPMLIGDTLSEVRIRSVKVTSAGQPRTVFLTENDLDSTCLVVSQLPQLVYQGTVALEVVTRNDSDFIYQPGELVMARFGREVFVDMRRSALTDPNNDGKHTGSLVVNSRGQQVYYLFIDVIHYRTLFCPDEEYHAQQWMIPVRVP